MSQIQPSDDTHNGITVSSATTAWLGRKHQLLIDGVWQAGAAGETLATYDPASDKKLAEVAIGDATDIDLAVSAARSAFAGPWRRLSHFERARLLHQLAELVEAKTDVFTELEILDNGMPSQIARLTIHNIVEMIRYYAGLAQQIEGTTTSPPRHISQYSEALTYTVKEPVGVAGLIVPWNVPISTAILKLAPALAAGCTAVIKPSELTPLSVLLLGELIVEAGIPPGVVNIVNGYGETAGQRLAEHPDVDKISFTGSTEVGRKIVQAAIGNLKKVSLELGGKSPVVVMPDAKLETAIPGVALATFFLQGQNCMAGTRIFIHDDIHDQMIAGLKAFCGHMKLGHGIDPATMLGPLISSQHRERVLKYIQSGLDEGATLVTGGECIDGPGNFVAPTIFANCTPEMAIVREEIFGPVMAIQRFGSLDLDAIAELANDTCYGLSGSVWTQNLQTAHALVARIRAGQVSVNCHGAVGTNIPFGGFKQSGWGREFGREGLEAYLDPKAVTVQL
ncbi:MAG: aldehyde dehydrogenase [Gammaproteobacteria bacterium]